MCSDLNESTLALDALECSVDQCTLFKRDWTIGSGDLLGLLWCHEQEVALVSGAVFNEAHIYFIANTKSLVLGGNVYSVEVLEDANSDA